MSRSLIIVALVLLSLAVLAQPGDPGGDPDVPLSGIEILLGVGALFGARRAILAAKNKD